MVHDLIRPWIAGSVSERLFALLVVVALGVGPVLTVLENRLLIWPGLILMVATLVATQGKSIPFLWKAPLGRLLLAVPVIGLALSPFAFEPGTAVSFTLATILPIFVVGGIMVGTAPLLPPQHKQLLLGVSALGLTACVLFLALESWLSGLPSCPSVWSVVGDSDCLAPSDFNQTACIIAVWIAPVAAHLWNKERPIFLMALIAASAFMIFVGESESAKLGFLAAMIIGAVCWIVPPKRLIQLLLALWIVGTLTTPLLVPRFVDAVESSPLMEALPPSAVHRLVIWDMAIPLIHQRPLTGWGFNNARKIGDHYGDIVLEIPAGADGSETKTVVTQVIPNHPHNAGLEWWIDLGGVGVLVLTAFIALAVLLAVRQGTGFGRNRVAGAAFAACLAATITIAQSAYGSWQPWWMTTVFIAALLVIAAMSDTSEEDRSTRTG